MTHFFLSQSPTEDDTTMFRPLAAISPLSCSHASPRYVKRSFLALMPAVLFTCILFSKRLSYKLTLPFLPSIYVITMLNSTQQISYASFMFMSLCWTLPVPVSVGLCVACRLMNGNFPIGEVLILAIVSHNGHSELSHCNCRTNLREKSE